VELAASNGSRAGLIQIAAGCTIAAAAAAAGGWAASQGLDKLAERVRAPVDLPTAALAARREVLAVGVGGVSAPIPLLKL